MSISNELSTETSFTVNEDQNGQRLDVYLAANSSALSRSQVKIAIEEGDVLVNGKTPKVSQLLKTGDIIALKQNPPELASAFPEDIPLEYCL